MFIEKLLQLMAEKKASDIFFSVGSPIMIKIQGNIMPVNPQLMDAEAIKKIIYEFLTPTQIATFEKDLELNLSKPMPGLFRSIRPAWNDFNLRDLAGWFRRYLMSALLF